LFKFLKFACVAGAFLASPAIGQPASPPAAVPPGFVLATTGVLHNARVLSVAVTTDHKVGPETQFYIQPATDGAQAETFIIRNDDPAKAMERGEIAGLLMGAAEASIWGEEPRRVEIRYETVNGEKIITAVAIGEDLAAPSALSQ
jgi:hypothetical protein